MGLYIFFTIISTLYFFFFCNIVFLVTEWRTKWRRLSNSLDNVMEGRAVDSLLNFETVKYYNAEEFDSDRYADAINEYQKY